MTGTAGSQDRDLRHALSHVLWIGGATDAGKTTVAHLLAERYDLLLYHYDEHDRRHHERLALTVPAYRDFLAASMDERWVHPGPEELALRAQHAFRDRFPLVVEDILALSGPLIGPLSGAVNPWSSQTPGGLPPLLAEGFGFTPELLSPVLVDARQAVWMVPAEAFKLASMQRRGKPSFRFRTSDPERVARNLLARDMLLAALIKEQALSRGYTVFEVDGSRSAEEMAALVERHFGPFLERLTR